MQETIYELGQGLGLTLALAADLHNRDGKEAIASLEKQRPDLLLVAGDLVRGEMPEDGTLKMQTETHILPFLQACTKIAPVYLSLGNHEWLLCRDDLKLVEDCGVHLLDNAFETIRIGHHALVLGGLTSGRVSAYRQYHAQHSPEVPYVPWIRTDKSWERPETDWLSAFEAAEGFRVLLCHHPEYWERDVRDRKIDLCVSGHAHGGQIRLFGRGLFAPGQGILPRYTSGMHTGPNGKLVISRGLSNTAGLIPRLFNPTEMVYCRL